MTNTKICDKKLRMKWKKYTNMCISLFGNHGSKTLHSHPSVETKVKNEIRKEKHCKKIVNILLKP